nr:aspartyl-phosphate phosphatase Spo0E family protein [Lysinibacillus timonensis]
MGKTNVAILELECQIFHLRTRMIQLGRLKGLVHPETVKCSQELDEILNQLHIIKSN